MCFVRGLEGSEKVQVKLNLYCNMIALQIKEINDKFNNCVFSILD